MKALLNEHEMMCRFMVDGYEPYELSFYRVFERNAREFGDNDEVLVILRQMMIDKGEAPTHIEGTLREAF